MSRLLGKFRTLLRFPGWNHWNFNKFNMMMTTSKLGSVCLLTTEDVVKKTQEDSEFPKYFRQNVEKFKDPESKWNVHRNEIREILESYELKEKQKNNVTWFEDCKSLIEYLDQDCNLPYFANDTVWIMTKQMCMDLSKLNDSINNDHDKVHKDTTNSNSDLVFDPTYLSCRKIYYLIDPITKCNNPRKYYYINENIWNKELCLKFLERYHLAQANFNNNICNYNSCQSNSNDVVHFGLNIILEHSEPYDEWYLENIFEPDTQDIFDIINKTNYDINDYMDYVDSVIKHKEEDPRYYGNLRKQPQFTAWVRDPNAQTKDNILNENSTALRHIFTITPDQLRSLLSDHNVNDVQLVDATSGVGGSVKLVDHDAQGLELECRSKNEYFYIAVGDGLVKMLEKVKDKKHIVFFTLHDNNRAYGPAEIYLDGLRNMDIHSTQKVYFVDDFIREKVNENGKRCLSI